MPLARKVSASRSGEEGERRPRQAVPEQVDVAGQAGGQEVGFHTILLDTMDSFRQQWQELLPELAPATSS